MNTSLRVLLTVLLAGVAAGQTPAKTPTLSTSDKVALQTLEQRKAEARKQFEDAQKGELDILREWQTAHPGWHIDPNTLTIAADEKPQPNPKESK